ncbi:MAG: 50S ribosomal protein L23 [Chitinophagaceae bacterium]|nr:50S ribosomal protein L23 [Anaerolineae bacterium]
MPELHLYDVLRRPIVSEKSNMLTDQLNKYVFEVALNANKTQIREAIEVIFNVKVSAINTMKMPAKRGKRGRKIYVRSSAYKKAVVTLQPGDEIKLFDV